MLNLMLPVVSRKATFIVKEISLIELRHQSEIHVECCCHLSFAINRKNERCIFCQNSVTETEY
jgi:hypothetical protein